MHQYKVFYEKVYKHNEISQYFYNKIILNGGESQWNLLFYLKFDKLTRWHLNLLWEFIMLVEELVFNYLITLT